jgi:hypothetical protein
VDYTCWPVVFILDLWIILAGRLFSSWICGVSLDLVASTLWPVTASTRCCFYPLLLLIEYCYFMHPLLLRFSPPLNPTNSLCKHHCSHPSGPNYKRESHHCLIALKSPTTSDRVLLLHAPSRSPLHVRFQSAMDQAGINANNLVTCHAFPIVYSVRMSAPNPICISR